MSRHNTSKWTPAFSMLLTGELLSAIVGALLTVAIPIVAVVQLHADALAAAALAAVAQAAPLLFGLSAGAIADQVNRRKLLVLCNLLRGCLLFLLTATTALDLLSIPLLAAVAFALSCTQLMCDSAMVAAIPVVVKRSTLTWANGWFQAIGSLANAIGPLLAGATIQLGALGPLFLACGAAHLVASFAFSTVDTAAGQVESLDTHSHVAQIKEGVAMLWRDPVQRAIALSSASFNFFHSAFFALFPIYALNALALTPVHLGILISAAGLAGLGAAIFAEPLIKKISVSTTLIGSLFVVLPFSLLIALGADAPFPYNAILIIIAFSAWDFAVVLNLIIEHSIRQAMVPAHLLSRVAATQRFVSWGIDPLGALVGGFVAVSWVGLPNTLNLSMLGMGASGLILLFSPSVRRLPRAFEDDPAIH